MLNYRKLLFATLLLAANAIPLVAGPITGSITKVRTEERVKVGGFLGMRVHVDFNVKEARGKECRVRATFFSPDGKPIPSPKNADDYTTGNGNAGITKFVTPKYDDSDYEDLKMFIPYWALNVKGGDQNKMKFRVTLRCGSVQLDESEWFDFSMPLGKAD